MDNIRTDLYILLKPQSELGYLGTNFRTSQRSLEYYSEKLSEIDCKYK